MMLDGWKGHVATAGGLFLLLSLVLGCSQSEFSGSNKPKKKGPGDSTVNPTSADSQGNPVADGNGPGGPGGPGGPDGLGGPGSPDGGSPVPKAKPDVEDNKDGTITQKFFGRNEYTEQVNVDVVFLVDTSGSMKTEKAYLEKAGKEFATQLGKEGKLNYQIFVVGKGFNIPDMDPARFTTVDTYIGSHDALHHAMQFLDNPQAALPLRKNATKELVVVTDDDSNPGKVHDGSKRVAANEFIQYLDSKKADLGTVRLNGFVWKPESKGNNWCTHANTGSTYLEIAKHKEYGGEMFDLCTPDWNDLVKRLAESIITANALRVFSLEEAPDLEVGVTVKINDQVVADGDWTFDDAKNAIVFNVGSAPKLGDQIVVTFTPKR